MTDARYPETWLHDRRIQRLTDKAHRSFILAAAWSTSNRTDGYLEPEDLTLIPGFTIGIQDELVASGLWAENGRGWLDTTFATTQTSRTQCEAMDKVRAKDRDRKAKVRANAGVVHTDVRADIPPDIPPPVRADIPPDIPPPVQRKIQDRTGQASPVPNVITKPPKVTNLPSQKPELRLSGTSPGEPDTVRGCRLAEDWQPSERVKVDLRGKYPELKLGTVLEEFRDYWCAIPGQRGRKVDWDRTFRNRVREVADLPRYQRNGHQVRGADKKAADWQALKERCPE